MSSTPRRPVVVALADMHDAALRFGAELALREHRPLRLVHVLREPYGTPATHQVRIRFEATELAAEGLLAEQRERAQDLTGGQVPVDTSLGRGRVVDALIDEGRDAHVLVVQRRAGRRLGHLLTGGTAGGLAVRAPVPVVSVPQDWGGDSTPPHMTVGLDDGEAEVESTLLRTAFAEAERRGATLTVLHAWYLPNDYGVAPVEHPTMEDWRTVAQQRVERRLDSWRRNHSSVAVTVEVPHKRPIDALIEASDHTDVLVLGRRTPSMLDHLGSTVRTTVRGARCPVLVVTSAQSEAAGGKRGSPRRRASAAPPALRR
jgi:nucleotide-binding universal stress UspA family protein